MSKIISLIKYDYSNKKLYEDNSETIETAFISEDCLKIISELMAIVKIYEESLLELLSTLFSVNYIIEGDKIRRNPNKRWNINCMLDDKGIEIMSENIDYSDW